MFVRAVHPVHRCCSFGIIFASTWVPWFGGVTSLLYVCRCTHPCFGIALDYLKVSVACVGGGGGQHEANRATTQITVAGRLELAWRHMAWCSGTQLRH